MQKNCDEKKIETSLIIEKLIEKKTVKTKQKIEKILNETTICEKITKKYKKYQKIPKICGKIARVFENLKISKKKV